MIHEGMLLEYSGRPLGVLLWATLLKQIVLISLIVALFAPFGIAQSASDLPLAAFVYITKLAAAAVTIAVIESGGAKLRILKLPDLLGAASALACLALIAAVVVR